MDFGLKLQRGEKTFSLTEQRTLGIASKLVNALTSIVQPG